MKSKVKIKNDSIECFDYMKTNKDNLKNIIKDNTILPIIEELVIRTNKIVIQAYQFLKLYLLHLYENNIPFPELTKDYISDIFKVITKRKCGSGGYTEKNMPSQLKILTNFYNSHYSQTISDNDILYYDKLSYILPYESIDMITNINNNIQEHFISHLNRYVNVVFNFKSQRESITKNTQDKVLRKELHKNLYQEFNKIKKDLISINEELISDEKYHEWIKEQKIKLYPSRSKTLINSKTNNIYYELKSNTQYFLNGMFHICSELEKINNERIIYHKDSNQIKLFNVLPLRTNIIAKNICLDTFKIEKNLYNIIYLNNIIYVFNNEKIM